MKMLTDKRTILVIALLFQTTVGRPNARSSSNLSRKHDNAEKCTTKSCRATAESLLSSMNKNVNPCDDFYEYVCGNWTKQDAPIPNDRTTGRVETWLLDVPGHIKILYKVPLPLTIKFGSGTQKSFIKSAWTRVSFRFCLKGSGQEASEHFDPDLVKVVLRNIRLRAVEEKFRATDGWPMSYPGWTTHWQSFQSDFAHNYAVEGLFDVRVLWDPTGKGQYRISLRKPKWFRLTKQQLVELETGNREPYLEYIMKIVDSTHDFGVYPESAELLREAVLRMIDFEIGLAKITMNSEESELMTIRKLQELYNKQSPCESKSKINWLKMINSVFGDNKINETEIIRVENPYFFKNLVRLLNITTEETIVNYVGWKFIAKTINYTSPNMLRKYDEILRPITGTVDYQNRNEFCLTQLGLQDAIRFAYTEDYVLRNALPRVQEIMHLINFTLWHKIGDSKWIKPATKYFLKEKMNHMKIEIDYTESTIKATGTYNFTKLVAEDHHFKNVFKYWRYKLKENLQLLRLTSRKRRWLSGPIATTVNYDKEKNIIKLPVALILSYLFDPAQPAAVSYGQLGAIIADAITQVFDKDDKMKKGNENTIQCYAKKLSNYYKIDKNTDVNKILMTNIKTALAFETAYKAFKQRKQTPIDRSTLPHMKFLTHPQLFFVSLANGWCSDASAKFPKKVLSELEHAESRFRVIGALSNMQSFGETFQCPEGSPMNPTRKCEL